MSDRRFATLTGIRGAAAVWVVTFHAYPLVGLLFDWPDRTQVPVIRDGFMAVDLFFILSGFVLSHAYADRFQANMRGALGYFLAARVRRIFPLHWVCLAITVLLVKSFPDNWWGPGPFSSQSLALSALLVQNWVPSAARAWNDPSWSLSAEWFAYLVFPFVAWTIAFLNNRALALSGAVMALLTLEVLLLSTGSTTLNHVGMGGMARCLCEFLAGVLIWKTTRGESGAVLAKGDAWMALGLALLGVAIAMPLAQTIAPFGFAALIVGCVLPSRAAQSLFGNRLLVWLGEISFSVYLIHAPVLGSLSLIANMLQLQGGGLLSKLALLVAIPALVLGASVLLWHFVERPSRMLFQPSRRDDATRKLEPRISITLAFWVTMIVAMALSETAADFLSGSMALGYSLSTALLFTAVASILVARIEAGRFGSLLDWCLILCVGAAGTTLSDFLDISAGLGDVGVCSALALTLLVMHGVGRLMHTADHVRFAAGWKVEAAFRWVTVLLAGALCTSLGDLLTERFGLNYLGGSLLILSGLACIAVAAVWTHLPRGLLFWAAFVLIRPLGVTFGDVLAKSQAAGGMQFGAGNTSLILMAAIIVLIPIAGQRIADLVRQLQGRQSEPRPA